MDRDAARDWLAAVEAFAPRIAARADEIERARRLPPDLAREMAVAGLFRVMIPRAYNGMECDPASALRTFEIIAAADASAGWCTMIAATSALKSAYLEPRAAMSIYGDRTQIYGGVFAPSGRAVRDGDEYVVSGHWRWASGSQNCDWLAGGCIIVEDGETKTLENGLPASTMAIFPAAAAELRDTWYAAGLAGSGSVDMVVENARVPVAHAASIVSDSPRIAAPLYAFPSFGLLALGIAAVALGNGAAALEDLVALAASKRPQGSRRSLAERAQAQAEIARADAELGAARAFFYEKIARAVEAAAADGAIDLRTRAALRLVATHATRAAAQATRIAYDLAGGDSVFLSSPLQRRFRDAHVMTQHMMVVPSSYELVGRIRFGLPTDATFL